LKQILEQESGKPFDLTRDLMLRVLLIQLGSQEHILLVNLHHIASDGWSMGVLFRELELLYQEFCMERTPNLKELPLQYGDFAVWQRQWLEGHGLAEQVSYWRRQLEGIPSTIDLPTDRTRPVLQSCRGARSGFIIPKAVRDDLKLLGNREKATLFMVCWPRFNPCYIVIAIRRQSWLGRQFPDAIGQKSRV